MPKISRPEFKAKFNELQTLAGEINYAANHTNKVTTVKKAETVETLLAKYTDLSSSFDPTLYNETQKQQLKELRTTPFNEMRRALKKTVATIKDNITTNEVRKAKEERDSLDVITTAQEQIAELLPEVRILARAFLASTVADDQEERAELLSAYETGRDKLQVVIDKLPRDKRALQMQEVVLLNISINEHGTALYKQQQAEDKAAQERAMKEQIRLIVVQSHERVLEMPVADMLLDAPQDRLALRHDEDALVLADLPERTQHLLEAPLLMQLVARKYDAPESDNDSLMTKIVRAVGNNLSDIAEGKKPYMTFNFAVNSKLAMVHIDLATLANDPVTTITELAYKIGKMGGKIEMTAVAVASSSQATALQRLNGQPIKQLIKQHLFCKFDSTSVRFTLY